MAQPPTENAEATRKRDLARRARRLAQTQMLAAERERLFKYADELDVEAETLEQGMRGASLPPVAAVPQVQQQVQQQQVQQQQSADTSTQTSEPPEKD